METILYPSHPFRCILTGPSESGKSVFPTHSISNIINELKKNTLYSTSLHQDLYQKKIKCFRNYKPIHINAKILNEGDIDIVIDEIVNDKDFPKSPTEIEIYELIENLKYPQEYKDGGIITLDDLIEKEMNDLRVRAMFKRSRHNNLSIFTISQSCYELPQRTIRANGKIYHIFKPNNFRDVQNLYQDKASMDMTLNKIKYLNSTCWDKNINLLPLYH